AGDLFIDEAVEGLVGVEGADDVVAVAPDGRLEGVAFVGIGVGVAGKVEPATGETLAVRGSGEQVINYAIERVRGRVAEKGVLFGERRRKSGEGEINATENGPRLRGGRGLPPFFFELREDKRVDRRADPGLIFDRRNS